MNKMLICPLTRIDVQKGEAVCLEENCAIWIPKGFPVKTVNKKQGMTTYDREGCCAIKALVGRTV